MRYAHVKILVSLMVISSSSAQAQDESQMTGPRLAAQNTATPTTLLVVEGPYTLKDSFSVFGYVIARKAATETVTFKPCTGEAIEIEETLLATAPAGCESETPEDGHPVTVACADIPQIWDKAMSDILAHATAGTIGAVFQATEDSKPEQVAPPDNDFTLAKFAEVKAIQPCGGVLAGFSGSGAPIAGIVAVEPSGGLDR